MSKFFIDRPVFAWVVAIFIIFFGLLSLKQLPVEQYPSVGAPKITISTVYPGASASVHEQSVLSIIEKEMNGIDNLDYMQASASANGTGSLTLTFKSGTDEDIAQVNVQNRLARAESRLPASVKQNGLNVSKSSSGFLMVVALLAGEGSAFDVRQLNDYAVRNIVPELQRIDGVGSVNQFGAETAMRIWLDPEKMRSYSISAPQVNAAIASQNLQIAAGAIGELPANQGQLISAVINVDTQLKTVEDFENIVITHKSDGSSVKIKDVARVELGEQMYAMSSRVNGQISSAMGIQLSNTGNAVATAKAVKNRMSELETYFPSGMKWMVPYDTSKFVEISITKVIHTLLEAMFLVFVVMFLFLQNIRYTIIPSIVVPISLLGALALMTPLGMSINVLTMFAMVLVIGIVVDDAIVVVENVERLMAEEGLTPYQATVKSMGQISSAILGITIVNIVVFVPMAFFPGATGSIFRQFALVMATSIGFSGFLALTLTPALCVTILKPIDKNHQKEKGFFAWFNRLIKRLAAGYEKTLAKLIRISYAMFVFYIALIISAIWVFVRIPTSFLPEEDQGFVISIINLPSGATKERTIGIIEQMENLVKEIPETENIVAVQGFSFMGNGQNMGLMFITLKDWAERTEFAQSAKVISRKLMGATLKNVSGANVFTLSPPAIPELGTSSGFEFILEDRGVAGREALLQARNQLLGLAAQSKIITEVRPGGLEDAPQLRLTINRESAFAHGISLDTVAKILATNLASSHVNDFPNQGRLQRVNVQADAKARMQAEDIMKLDIPNNKGTLTPLSAIATISWETGPMAAQRYNGYPSMSLSGKAVAGKSSGDAMREVEALAKQLPPGFAIEWTGLSLEEQRGGNQEIYIYLATAFIVFLCLAALYESWSIPVAVLLAVPLGIFGVALGVMGRNIFNYQLLLHFAGEQVAAMAEQFSNDVYFRIGMITVMGLVAKNAILIIEFAKEQQEAGIRLVQSALTAAHLRFRPIIMTSFAFILGVVPLYIASGASSASQRAIGTSVFWGMLAGTILGLILIPIFFVIVRRLFPMRQGLDKYAVEHKNEI